MIKTIKLTGSNAETLGPRKPSTEINEQEIKESILKTQMWHSPLDKKAIKSLNISALSIMKTIAAQNSSNKQLGLIKRPQNQDNGKKLFVGLYLKTKIPNKAFFVVDTGADISLIHISELKKLLTKNEIQKNKSENTHIVHSFSSQPINILFNITIPWSYEKYGRTTDLTFCVYDQSDTREFLIGQDNMRKLGMIPSYANPVPSIIITQPVLTKVESLFEYPSKGTTCSANTFLKPHETKAVIFKPHQLSLIKKGDHILVSESNQEHIYITPSRYEAYSQPNIPLMACVTNLSDQTFSGEIEAETEELTDTEIIRSHETDKISRITQIQKEVLYMPTMSKHVNTIQLKENLPTTDSEYIPLTSFLLSTPYESKMYKNQPILEDATADLPPEDPELIKELQQIPFPTNGGPTTPEIPTDIPPHMTIPRGYEIACTLPKTVTELLQLTQYDPVHQKHLTEIFVERYPTVVTTHPYDIGQLSDTLGFYKIQLKDNTPLPAFRKMYYLAPQDKQQLRDILEFLTKYNIIKRASHHDKIQHLHASAAYLVAKKNLDTSARLIIDFRLLNEAILYAPPVIPSLPNTLQALRNKYMYSTTDITMAYHSMSISEESQPLTRFVTDFGSYTCLKLPQGLSISPACWAELTHRMIHMRPKLGPDNQPIFLEPHVVALEDDYLEGCQVFYDDIIFATELQSTYELTVKVHYELISKVMERLAFHKAKINLEKSEFGRTYIKFLGWNISHNTLFPDQKRVSKLLEAPFPETLQGMRAFTGLIQTIRNTLPCTFMKELALLHPLCSSTQKYSPTNEHRIAFQTIKTLLTETPIFSRIIDPNAKKLLFVDASDTGCYSSVLCQIEQTKPTDIHIPETLSLSDPVDQLIFNHKLCYEPVPLYTLDHQAPKSSLPQESLPQPIKNIEFLNSDFLGYTEATVHQSLFISIRSIQYAYGCQLSDATQLRQEIIKKLKTTLTHHKILDFQFHNDKPAYHKFLSDFTSGTTSVDDNFYLVDILANILNRPITVISTLPQHKGKEIMQFVHHSQKPPFVLGAYQKNKIIIFRPYYVNRNSSFDLKEIANKFHIVAYHAKTISKSDSLKCIAEKELFGILTAMDHFSKLIGKSEILCLTDSKPLFLLFSNPVSKSVSKLSRWGLKLHLEYPQMKFRFISTKNNIADYLTRDYGISKANIKRLPIANYQVDNLNDHIDPLKEFSIDEWKDFVSTHEHLLKYVDPKLPLSTIKSLSKNIKDIHKLIDPSDKLQEKLTHQNIANEQKKEFTNIINKCISSPNFTTSKNGLTFKLSNGLLYIKDKEQYKIFLPASLEGLLIAYKHLSTGHSGVAKMSAILFPYYFPRKLHKITHLCARCFACTLNNPATRKNVTGSFPLPQHIYETTVADLAESLPPSDGFNHLLIFCCPLTNFLTGFPIKSKTANSVAYHFQYNIFQNFRVKYFLSDNGKCFTEKKFLMLLHSLNIQRIQIASLRPQSNGKCESAVKQVKYLLKKTLSTFPDYPWTSILPILLKLFNTTPHPNTGFSPLELLHGKNSPSAESSFSSPPPDKIYPLLKNFKIQLDDKISETKAVTEFIRTEMQLSKIDSQNRLNKNRVTKQYNIGDFVFCKDRSIRLGTNPSLRTVYSDDPHIILQERPTTLVTQRLSDSFPSVYSKDDVKIYNRLDASFSHLPQEVKDVLINKFTDLDKLHFDILQKHAKLPLPQGQILNQLSHISESENSDDDQSHTTSVNQSHPSSDSEQSDDDGNKINDPTSPQLPSSSQATPPITPTIVNATSNPPTQNIVQPLPIPTTPLLPPPPPKQLQNNVVKKKHKYATRQNTKTNINSSDEEEEDTTPSKQVTFD